MSPDQPPVDLLDQQLLASLAGKIDKALETHPDKDWD
jgi:hypothetical protein